MRTRIKICGLMRPEDVALAARLGADALGFVMAPGKRQLTPVEARDLTAGVPAWINKVGVFAPEQRKEAPAIAEHCRFDTLQLHGAPDPAFCAYYRGRFTIVPVLSVSPPGESGEGLDAAGLAAAIAELAPYADAILLDTAKPGVLGGTGTTFDWSVLDALACEIPLLVAGGLSPANVGTLLKAHRVWGVDVSSGVESAPGRKDPERLKAFFEAV